MVGFSIALALCTIISLVGIALKKRIILRIYEVFWILIAIVFIILFYIKKLDNNMNQTESILFMVMYIFSFLNYSFVVFWLELKKTKENKN